MANSEPKKVPTPAGMAVVVVCVGGAVVAIAVALMAFYQNAKDVK